MDKLIAQAYYKSYLFAWSLKQDLRQAKDAKWKSKLMEWWCLIENAFKLFKDIDDIEEQIIIFVCEWVLEKIGFTYENGSYQDFDHKNIHEIFFIFEKEIKIKSIKADINNKKLIKEIDTYYKKWTKNDLEIKKFENHTKFSQALSEIVLDIWELYNTTGQTIIEVDARFVSLTTTVLTIEIKLDPMLVLIGLEHNWHLTITDWSEYKDNGMIRIHLHQSFFDLYKIIYGLRYKNDKTTKEITSENELKKFSCGKLLFREMNTDLKISNIEDSSKYVSISINKSLIPKVILYAYKHRIPSITAIDLCDKINHKKTLPADANDSIGKSISKFRKKHMATLWIQKSDMDKIINYSGKMVNFWSFTDS